VTTVAVEDAEVTTDVTYTTMPIASGMQYLVSRATFVGTGLQHEIAIPLCSDVEWIAKGLGARLQTLTMFVLNTTKNCVWSMPFFSIFPSGGKQLVGATIDTIENDTYDTRLTATFTLTAPA
jgi:hypothetical protein